MYCLGFLLEVGPFHEPVFDEAYVVWRGILIEVSSISSLMGAKAALFSASRIAIEHSSDYALKIDVNLIFN